VTGLPRDLWGQSRSADIAARLADDSAQLLPAMQDLLYTLLLAELDPPADSRPDGLLFRARIDRLLALGALEQAREMLNLSGSNDAQLFRRSFDVALLLRDEDRACDKLRAQPALSPTFPARIFCLARGGDWNAAALSLEVGTALGYLSDFEQHLLARFLDPHLSDGQAPLPPPRRMSPLTFRLMEAIGEPISTSGLPVAFSWADLNSNTGWRAQIEAAERLVRTGALDPNRLFGYYSERKPAASGGVWDRVEAIQALTGALDRNDIADISAALPSAWEAMQSAELEVPFAELFAHRLKSVPLEGTARSLVFRIGLLSPDYEVFAADHAPLNDQEAILVAIAQGRPGPTFLADPETAAIRDGFRARTVPVRLQSLVESGRTGEAILRAIALLSNGANGDLDELTDGLAFLRAAGLEDVARRAALQVMLLDRRG